ncbi:MAG: CBS domain-containing protein [Methanomassiliicoccales archaeon]|nr:MAG: CBS domain-containing protein [Methanomassiliicoccales archaeon]
MKNDVREILVEEIMSKRPRTGAPDMTVQQAAKVMSASRVGSLVIVDKDAPIGILTERDFVNKIVAEGRDPSKVLVREVMSAPLRTIGPETKVTEAAKLMSKWKVRRLPVTTEGRLVGMLTENDILRLSPALIDVTREWSRIMTGGRSMVEGGTTSGYCEICGGYSQQLRLMEGDLICPECAEDRGSE